MGENVPYLGSVAGGGFQQSNCSNEIDKNLTSCVSATKQKKKRYIKDQI